MKRIEPQDNAQGLAPHPHRLTLRGRPGGADFPPLCPNCGSFASAKIEFSKVFRRTDSDSPTQYIVSSVAVPFCDPCIATHRAQEQKPSRLSELLSSFATADMLGAVFPAMAVIFLTYLALGDVLHARGTRFMVELAIAAFFALIAWAQSQAVWKQTEHLRVPPQSSVTKAFDFSDDAASAFEPARFICTIRDAGFANAFRVLNIEREWLAQSPQALAERRRANWMLWAFGLLLAVFAVWELLQDLFS